MFLRRSCAVPRGMALLAAVLLASAPGGAALQAAETPRGADELRQTLGLEFVAIPGGEFEMGSEDGAADEKPVHRVRIAPFRMMKGEVTQAQWSAVMGSNPSVFSECGTCPVERVSWTEVQEFIKKASEQSGLPLRLPTEAEWEYAAKAGSPLKWAGTQNQDELGAHAWYLENAEDTTHPVCQRQVNAFGLCDMSGNVWEWVSDWYGERYYQGAPPENPAGPPAGSGRVFRGGSWSLNAWFSRTACRYRRAPDLRFGNLGFRLALPPAQP